MLPDNWNKMSPDEKFEHRLTRWTSTDGRCFATPHAAQLYRERTERYAAVLKLDRPDRVPRILSSGDYAAHYAGITLADMFYDYGKAVHALIKFQRDFDLDYSAGGSFRPGKVYDILDYTLYRLPGHQLQASQSFQYVEAEYMRADEYDAFIANPEGFMLRTYIPRVMTALRGWETFPGLLASTELPFVLSMTDKFNGPSMIASLQALAQAAQATAEWLTANAQVTAVSLGELGLPGTAGGFTKAPFDYLGDTLRGTRGIMLDMFRQPNKVLAAVERLVPLAIDMGVSAANNSGNPFATIPLHKGADGFMSNASFEKFYWPSLKETILGLIREGVVPYLFVEGSYNQRLDIIADSGLPAGRTMWAFDRTDMKQAKQKFGSWACIGGNIPASLFKTGTPQMMQDCVKEVMDICAPGGGFFIAPGAGFDVAQVENVVMYLQAAKEYGKY